MNRQSTTTVAREDVPKSRQTAIVDASTRSLSLATAAGHLEVSSNAVLSKPDFSVVDIASGMLQRHESDIANLAKSEVKVGPCRLSRTRTSLLQSVDTYGLLSRRRRGSVVHQLDGHNDIPEESFSTLLDVTRDPCKALDKNLPVDRLFLVARPSTAEVRSQDIADLLRDLIPKLSDLPFHASMTGFCLLYPNHAVMIFESTETSLHAIMRALKKNDKIVTECRVVFCLHDVPERILNGFSAMTVEIPFDNFAENDQTGEVNVQQAAKIFMDRAIQLCLKVSALYKVEEEPIRQQILSQINRLFVHPDYLNILLASDLLFPISSYLRLCEGVLSLDGLGDEFEWAYPTAPKDV